MQQTAANKLKVSRSAQCVCISGHYKLHYCQEETIKHLLLEYTNIQ